MAALFRTTSLLLSKEALPTCLEGPNRIDNSSLFFRIRAVSSSLFLSLAGAVSVPSLPRGWKNDAAC